MFSHMQLIGQCRFASSMVGRMTTCLTYPVRPPAGYQNGRVVTPTHWDKIGDIFPKEQWTGDTSRLHDDEDPRTLHVTDARFAKVAPTLAANGFELRKSPTKVTNFLDDDQVRHHYYDETAALVKMATGAQSAFVFQHMRRDSMLHNKESTAAQNQRSACSHGAVQRVHADYTPENGPHKLRELEQSGVVPVGAAAGRRWSIVNVWRSIDTENPVQSLPLAVLDASTVQTDSMFSYALVMAEADPPLVGFNNGVTFHEKHSWNYYSQMTHDEALIFYTYDGASSPTRFVFHTAFRPEEIDEAALPRKSLECRCLAIF
eukprot:gnl/MRDRNA2_/MRDRNA2_152098_c0_seq1.p1 gnl/MRDRNA2_/MRDRNA2_152098_c0~~gnl/MRDRNA2_/MRDRNA2_152098_c0_seq1.p1  ORF type:complete len:317 (-),score=47.42 gnl/MRDRNA2_/MRDRNA2_152098_c0_seq1:78-1028(-)